MAIGRTVLSRLRSPLRALCAKRRWSNSALKIQTRLKNGMELVGLEVGPQTHPWAKYAGMFKDDPMFDDWQKAIAEYRRKVNEDPNYL